MCERHTRFVVQLDVHRIRTNLEHECARDVVAVVSSMFVDSFFSLRPEDDTRYASASNYGNSPPRRGLRLGDIVPNNIVLSILQLGQPFIEGGQHHRPLRRDVLREFVLPTLESLPRLPLLLTELCTLLFPAPHLYSIHTFTHDYNMALSILPTEVVHVILQQLDEVEVVTFAYLSKDLRVVAEKYMAAKLHAYLGYMPNKLEKHFRNYRDVGQPCVYDCVSLCTVPTPLSTRRDIRKVLVDADDNIHLIDIDYNYYYVYGDNVETDSSCRTRDLCCSGLAGSAAVIRLTDMGLKHGDVVLVADVSSWMALVVVVHRPSLAIYYLNTSRQLMRYSDGENVVCSDVVSCYTDVFVVRCATSSCLFMADLISGTISYTVSTPTIEKCVMVGELPCSIVADQEQLWQVNEQSCITLSSRFVKDICGCGWSKLVLLSHNGLLVLFEPEGNAATSFIDTAVISITGNSHLHRRLSYIRRPN
jgi:hypothetical protein